MAGTSPYLFNSDPALTDLHAGSFTVSFYLKIADLTDFGPADIVLEPAFKVHLNADKTVTFTIKNSVTPSETSVSSGAIVSGWNFIAVTCDLSAKVMGIFLNGAQTTVSFTDLPDSTLSQYVTNFQLGAVDRMDSGSEPADFGLDATSVWGRALSLAELNFVYGAGVGSGYPFLGGPFNLIFEGLLVGDEEKPIVLGSSNTLWSVSPSYDSNALQFLASLTPIYSGTFSSIGFNWYAENFSDKILFAQRDNRAQYWLPPIPNQAHDIPGLPVADAMWDGVTVFANHALLWKNDRLKWSDVNDFSTWIPVAETAVSAVLDLAADYIQPAPGGNVNVSITNPLSVVKSISLSGSLTFPSTAVGSTSVALLTIINTGTEVLNVTGISLPAGFTGSFSGTIPVLGSVPVLITFAPTAAITYDGAVSVTSDATTGTTTLPISGTGTGSTKIITAGGILDFETKIIGTSIVSYLVIHNSGNATLNISGITAPTGYTVGSFPSTIAAGGKAIVNITFSPTAAVLYKGDIVITSDGTNETTTTVGIAGLGVATFAGVKWLFVTDLGTKDFGNVPVGSTPTGTLRIYNIGTSLITVVGITLPTGFTGTFAGNISPGAHQDVTITFSPTSAIDYTGTVFVTTTGTVLGTASINVTGTGTASGKAISLDGDLAFGDTPVGGTSQGLLKISNVGTLALTVTSISYPSGFSGAYAGVVNPGETKLVIVTFSPTSAITYSGTLTVNSDATSGTPTFTVSGVGFNEIAPATLATGQYVTITDVRSGITYYNFYLVVSASADSLVLKLQDLTGATPAGLTIPADGRQFFTLDANEAGETQIVGAKQNGPIFRLVNQGDYCYSFKERSIQSIQYTGLGNGTFFIHNEVSGEGLLSRDAIVDRQDGTIIFLGHRELYAYQGGPNLVPVCQQQTRQLYKEIDSSRLEQIKVYHNEGRKEIWVVYPIVGGFRVLIWNYIEDSATLDDYTPSDQFTALGQVDWPKDLTWNQLSDSTAWEDLDDNVSWNSLTSGSIDHTTVLASADGSLKIHGLVYNRDGTGYKSVSETMDYDFEEPDIFKYVDVVVLGLDVKVPDNTPRYLSIQVGQQKSLSGKDIVWTPVQRVLVNGQAPVPVKVNPGGAGRYLRVRFTDEDPDVQWRISYFEIHARPGNTY